MIQSFCVICNKKKEKHSTTANDVLNVMVKSSSEYLNHRIWWKIPCLHDWNDYLRLVSVFVDEVLTIFSCINQTLSSITNNQVRLNSIPLKKKKFFLCKSSNHESCRCSPLYIKANEKNVPLIDMHAIKFMNFRLPFWLAWVMRPDWSASKDIIRWVMKVCSIRKPFSFQFQMKSAVMWYFSIYSINCT